MNRGAGPLLLALTLLAACSSNGASTGSDANANAAGAHETSKPTETLDGAGGFGSRACVASPSDPNNCGACGNRCGPSVLVSDQKFPQRLLVDDRNLYWTLQGNPNDDGAIMQMPLAGGPPIVLAAGQAPGHIAVDATHVYWTNLTDDGSVMSVPIGGGVLTTLAEHQGGPNALAVDANNVYWTTLSGTPCTSAPDDCIAAGTIMQLPLAGGTPITLASDQRGPGGLAVDSTNVYWTKDEGNLFEGAVMKVAIGGGTLVSLASRQTGVDDGIVVDESSVYFTGNSGAIGLRKVPISGGPVTQLLSEPSNAEGLILNASSLYWVDYREAGGSLMRLPLTGGSPTTLLSRINVTNIALDGSEIYWTEQNEHGSLMKLGATSCTNGTCGCPGAQLPCLGVCTELNADAANCGACGAHCADGESCRDGSCGR